MRRRRNQPRLVLLLASLAVLTGSASAQVDKGPDCTRADFDTSVQFRDGPGATYSIVIVRRSIVGHACTLPDSSEEMPTITVEGLEGQPNSIKYCYPCEYREPNGMYRVHPSVTVRPGAVITQRVGWRTQPATPDTLCVQPKWIGGPVFVVAPERLKPICSEVQVSWFNAAESNSLPTLSDVVPSELAHVAEEERPAFRITSSKESYYSEEHFYIHVEVLDQELQPNLRENCPVLELRHRSPDGDTRTDELFPEAFTTCKGKVMGAAVGDWRRGFDLDAGAQSRWKGFGEHEFQVRQFTGISTEGIYQFALSNTLKVQVIDPTQVERKWSGRDKGVWADITLDKTTYQVGQDIPLHIAIQNHDADVPIYSGDPVWDPPPLGLEVRDGLGRPLPAASRFESFSFWTGHGRGPIPYTRGNTVTIEMSLRREGWLPKQPGDYVVVVTWGVSTGPEPGEEISGLQLHALLKPYATAVATAVVRIAP